jgi:membrane protein YqaA with SNARE-associated domain
MDVGSELLGAGLWGLFLASFLAATILPFSSEAILAAMALGPWSTLSLWTVASTGNWLGGMSSYGIGRLGDLERIAKWLRTDPAKAQRLQHWVEKYGHWAALLTWLPFIGDPLAIALGLGKAPWVPVSVLMFIGKAARYAVVLAVLR